uniref:Carboxylic ester hydrolase n=1 Tax=Bionectria ochroleuca TaxID=29856 RepID=A0A8H7K372_BIOOC
MIWPTIAIAAVISSGCHAANTFSAKVELDHTTYVGTRLSNEPPKQRPDVQRATSFGDYCIGTNETVDVGVSEDCLFVNIWRPSNATRESKLPVWVFIQGGGFNLNYSPNYNGSEVVGNSNNNIVLVNFNWRVGVYGFLAGKPMEKFGDLNVGLLDQLAVLQWVQDHIHQFGGNPDHVVIHGSSAGAGSVALHLLNPANTRLFAGAIMESTFMPTQPLASELKWQYERFIQTVGCSEGNARLQMRCLREKATEELQKGNVATPFPGGPSQPLPVWPWTPCIDGDLIPDKPLDMYKRGEFIKVPMIIGNNENEGAYFTAKASTEEEVRLFIGSNYPRLSKTKITEITEYYPRTNPVPQHAEWFPSAEQAYGESTFTCPALAILNAAGKFDGSQELNLPESVKLWSYHMNVYDEEYVAMGLGCPHGYEEGLIFGPSSTKIPKRYQPPASFSTYNVPLVSIVMNYWISFVRTLSPNTHKDPSAPIWEHWGGGNARSKLLIRLGELRMEPMTEAEVTRCDFWNEMDRSL